MREGAEASSAATPAINDSLNFTIRPLPLPFYRPVTFDLSRLA